MSRPTNSAFCKPGNHFVPRGLATGYRVGDLAGLVCPEHRSLVPELPTFEAKVGSILGRPISDALERKLATYVEQHGGSPETAARMIRDW